MAKRIHTIHTDSDILDLANRFGSTSTLRRILRIARRAGPGECIVEEESSVSCGVYTGEYKGIYRKQFAGPRSPHTCTQLRFLRKTQNKTEFIGFCILRPKQKASISFAVVPPPHSRERDSYCLCSTDFQCPTKAGSSAKTVSGFPFIQQDGLYDCCAHVALLAMNWYLARKGLSQKKTISEIVELAREIPSTGRDFPSEGLGVLQIAHVVKKMGMSPLVYAYPPQEGALQFPPQRIIYHYIESGLPVLVGIPVGSSGHALVVIGHTVSPDNWWPIASSSYYRAPPSGGMYHCSTTWVDNFLISDDNLGPYLTVDKNFFEAHATKNLVVVVALPDDVLLKGEDAEVYAYRQLAPCLRDETASLSSDGTSLFWSRHFWEHYDNVDASMNDASDIVLRTFLSPGKSVINDFQQNDYPPEFKRLIKKTACLGH